MPDIFRGYIAYALKKARKRSCSSWIRKTLSLKLLGLNLPFFKLQSIKAYFNLFPSVDRMSYVFVVMIQLRIAFAEQTLAG